jgi:hypothetical protein
MKDIQMPKWPVRIFAFALYGIILGILSFILAYITRWEWLWIGCGIGIISGIAMAIMAVIGLMVPFFTSD